MPETVKPLAIDLFCGLGGWSDGLIAEGYNVIGFDIERHDYGTGGYPAQLVIQDVLTIHGSQFRDASLILASPPCQFFSYCAMPWSRAKQLARDVRSDGERTRQATALFDACFRIQREAIEAAGHFIPMVVENVRGAIPWVGRSRWNFGSFHLWGDVPALMPTTKAVKVGISWSKSGPGNPGKSFDGTAAMQMRDGRKVPGLAPGKFPPGGLAQGHIDGYKSHGMNWSNRELKGQDFTRVAGEQNGVKAGGGDWFGGYGGGFGWDCTPMRQNSSKSSARKAASAAIAKIPLDLARHIARTWRPETNA